MAITILNEMTNALLSPFMRPVLYFKVSGAGSVTTPTAEIEFNGTTEDVTFDAVFLETVATEHYFSVDLSDVMKYLMQTFDGVNYPDDLEFINGDRLQLFDEYFRSLTIDIYFERGTGNEQTLAQSNYWIYLAEQIPNLNGFYLRNIEILSNFQPLKWSKDTYNAIFFWQAEEGGLAITKGTTSLINNIASWTENNYATFVSSANNITSAIQASGAALARTNNLNVIAGDEIDVWCNLTLNSGVAPNIKLIRRDTDATVSNIVNLVAGTNTVSLISTYTGIVQIQISTPRATNFSLSNPYIIYPVGWYQLKFSKTLTQLSAGENTITIETQSGDAANVNINYDPDCTDVFNLCWQHPTLGYVSYPFRGAKGTTVSAKKTTELEKFYTTMVNQNSLKEIMGYDITKKLTLITKADEKYWPLLEYLYSSRHVYLFVGSTGANDSKSNWVECEVSGTYSTRSNRVRGEFSVTLTLPEQFNISF